MTLAPGAIGTGELAFRALGHAGKWLVLLVAGPDSAPNAAEVLREDIESMAGDTDETPAVVSASGGPLALATAFEGTPPGALLVCDLDAFTGDDWAKVDLLRSRYRRDHAVILVMTEQSMNTLMRHAPNLASWIRESWRWDESADSLSDAEREQRLTALREWAGFSDDELVRRAEQGALPADPEYAEWLVLVDRGDLIARGK